MRTDQTEGKTPPKQARSQVTRENTMSLLMSAGQRSQPTQLNIKYYAFVQPVSPLHVGPLKLGDFIL